MKIATLQFDPALGAFQQNVNRANDLLETIKPGELDLLVLPELAFTGYSFPSLEAITPFLEPTTTGPTTEWAIETARRLGCHVTVGYPETTNDDNTTNHNATVTVSPTGEILANYRKSFLYYTDETWAHEGTSAAGPFLCQPLGSLGTVGHGICMDINPYRFTAPWTEYEFAKAMLRGNARLVVLSMAWLTHRSPAELEIQPEKPDMETVAYWVERFRPLIEQAPQEPLIVVFANRCGVEMSREGSLRMREGEEIEDGDRACYAGSSCVMLFQGGGVRMFDRGEGVAILGKSEEGVLVVDTSQIFAAAWDDVMINGIL